MKGVIQRTYDAFRKKSGLAPRPVKQIADSELQAIYKNEYWDVVKGDTLADGVDLAVFDFGVNSGPSRARKALMASLGGDAAATVKKVCAKRRSFLMDLKTWSTFGKGWGSRVSDIEARGVKMALVAKGLPKASVAAQLKAEATLATDSASLAKKTASGSGLAAGGSVAQSVSSFDPTQITSIVILSIAVIGIAALIYFIMKNKANAERSEAYSKVSQET